MPPRLMPQHEHLLGTGVTARCAQLDTKTYQMFQKITKKVKLHPILQPYSFAVVALMLIQAAICPKISVWLQITQNKTQKHFVDKRNH